MDMVVYVDVLKDFLLPFLMAKGHRFMQGNDPKHMSRHARAFFEELNVNWWGTSASSADIDPIEHMSAELSMYSCL